MVDKTSSIPLYIQIQDMLIDQIRSGQLPAGSKVPSEHELVAQFNVSRMTARKALNELVSKGQLYRQQGKGTFVAESVVSYGLSTMLSFSGTLRAQGYEVTTRVLNQDVIPAPDDVAERLNLSPNHEVVLVRRLRIVNETPAAIHTAFMDYRIYGPLLELDLSRESLLHSIERISGTRMAYTKDSVEACLVKTEDAALLAISPGSPVLEVEGVAFTDNGHPTRFTKAVYRSDLFRLVVTNTGNHGTSLTMNDIPEP